MQRYRYPAYAIFISLWIILIPLAGYRTTEGNYFYPFFIISGVVSIINFLSFYVKKEEVLRKENKIMSFFRNNEDKCFFVFGAHILMLPYINTILNKIVRYFTNNVDVSTITFANQYPVLLIMCYIIKILVAIILCMICSCLIQRYIPRLHKVLTGR